MTPPTNNPAGTTHPYVLRLSVDVDPAGNPIHRHVTLFENGQDKGTVFLRPAEPFDSLVDAWSDLVADYTDYLGSQPTLF